MATRILLICHGASAATRGTAFPVDEPLEDAGLAATTALASTFSTGWRGPTVPTALTGPALRCRQTASALGLDATVDAGLADWDVGDWAGRSLDDLVRAVPEDVHAWTTDPDFDGHGGETLAALLARVGHWLDQPPPERAHRLLAVTHPAVIRAAVVHALLAPAPSFWRIDPAPLSLTELRGTPPRWSLYARLIG